MLGQINNYYESKKGLIGRDSNESVKGECRVEVVMSWYYPIFAPIPGGPAACDSW